MNIKIPEDVRYIINTLADHGYEAYVVGGCVRDAILGVEPRDWDICTPALPEQTMECFRRQRVIETGLKHGTVTLLLNRKQYEITTYQVGKIYDESNQSSKSEYVKDLRDDLSRRDFTMNAMAYNPEKGFIDYFGGISDLDNRIVCCTGNADSRFQEDPLRMMRAFRFAAVYGFTIDDNTLQSALRNKTLIKPVAAERFASELNKLILGDGAQNMLITGAPLIAELIPELLPMFGFEQNNPYHCFDVYNHTLQSVACAPKDVIIRLTMLFHDISKPGCYTEKDGIGHFYGHPKISSEMAEKILRRLKYDNKTVKTVTQLIFYHDTDIQPKKKHIRRWLNRIGEERLRRLLEVKRADLMSQSTEYRPKKLAVLDSVPPLIDEIIEQNECFSLKDLAVNGRDLRAAGLPEGKNIGTILNHLMGLVIDETIENDQAKLLQEAQRWF